ncbi:hypothetical protein H8787_01490 [Streptococcus sp. NSJ-72]|uniref:hypothetical protein n=1 Tax=Streptococcus sp. NSJ-72 TaxID=2763068 RepID=UPI0016518D47|nr:hypothetical protein [Streptococcus sp. NSJ-72]QNL42572.1 hypothetical protein H8787_01490 [Streptococcus sp. NSJ-72]
MSIFVTKSKTQRIKQFADNLAVIKAYIETEQSERALPYLAELQKLYIAEINKIINIR